MAQRRFLRRLRVSITHLPIMIVSTLLSTTPARSDDPPDRPMTFEYVGNGGNCNGCEWISAMGLITAETTQAFARLLTRYGPNDYVPMIMFHSLGGDIRAALELGIMIRERGIDTSVGETFYDRDSGWHDARPGRCLSACPFALLGGERRFVSEDDIIGIHQFYNARAILMPDQAVFSAQDAATQQTLMGQLVAYVQYMGGDPRLLTLAANTPPTEMMRLDAEALVELGIDNMSTFRQSPWTIEPYRGGVVAHVDFRFGADAPRHMTLFCRGTGSNNAFLLFSMPFSGIDADDFALAIFRIDLALDEQPMKTIHVGDPGVSTRGDSNGTFYLTVPLSDTEWDRIRLSEGQLSLSIDLPHVYGMMDGASVSLNGARPFLDVATRNCLASD